METKEIKETVDNLLNLAKLFHKQLDQKLEIEENYREESKIVDKTNPENFIIAGKTYQIISDILKGLSPKDQRLVIHQIDGILIWCHTDAEFCNDFEEIENLETCCKFLQNAYDYLPKSKEPQEPTK